MAMTSDLRYDFWDILKAPRLALSGKNLLAQARPLWFGYLVFGVLAYLAMIIEGRPFADAWAQYTFFPLAGLGLTHWYTYALWIAGIVAVVGFYDYGNLKVAKLAFEEVRGNYFFPHKEAGADARSNLLSLWVAGLLVLGLIVILALLQGVVSLISLIPGIGEVLYSLLYAVPFFLWSLFLVFLAFGLTTGILTMPAVIVAREKETFGATFYIYNIIWSQPLRWLGMTVFGLAAAKLGIWVIGYFFMRALQLTNFLSTLFAGEKVANLLAAAYNLLEPARPIFNFFTTLYPGSAIGYDWISFGGQYQPVGAEYVAALIIALALVALWIVIVSYGINIITCSQLLAFLVVHYNEDKVKLTEDLSKRTPEPNEIIPEKPAPEHNIPS